MREIVLNLNYTELLFLRASLERDRESIRKAIKRGIATGADLNLTEDLSHRLGVMFFTCAPGSSKTPGDAI